jgi:hypothetical protein
MILISRPEMLQLQVAVSEGALENKIFELGVFFVLLALLIPNVTP